MKFGWIKTTGNDLEERMESVKDALESSIPGIITEKEEISSVRELGNIKIVSDNLDADVVLINKGEDLEILKSAKLSGKETGVYVVINTKEDEVYATDVSRLNFVDYVVLEGSDWTIIPLENIIADLFSEEIKIVSVVTNVKDAEAAYEILEKGVDGVVLIPKDINEVKDFSKLIERMNSESVKLDYATVTKIEPVGSGDRVCIDTCSMMEMGEGMLIGSYSRGMFLVHSETVENPYVATRPFRVNAGPVHAYILCPENKTKYLSDLKAGDKVLVVSKNGETREAIIGRVKIEKRPLFLVEAEYNGENLRTILQNAETIRLVGEDGKPVSVVDLKVGTKVLIKPDENARHFGMAIKETIIEK